MSLSSELPVAIIGAGFSGSLLAINLLRQGARVALVERDGAQLARGLAFGTRRPEHLLNVRAANMSAFPDDPGHFLRWMGFAPGAAEANRFVPRVAYGQYLRELLVDALAMAGPRATLFEEAAVDLRFGPDGGAVVVLESGETLACRALVLALGNFPPAPHPALRGLARGACPIRGSRAALRGWARRDTSSSWAAASARSTRCSRWTARAIAGG